MNDATLITRFSAHYDFAGRILFDPHLSSRGNRQPNVGSLAQFAIL